MKSPNHLILQGIAAMFRRYAIVPAVHIRRLLTALVLVVIGALITNTVHAAFVVSGDVTPTTDPSNWTNSTYVNIGNTSYGSLQVDGDSDLTSFSARIGNQLGSTGVTTISGNGSTWTESGLLQIGYYGKGTLSIAGGATVINNDSAHIAEYTGSTGAVTVDGTNSTWTCNANLFLGHRGPGTLNITNGGTVSVDSFASFIGGSSSSDSRGMATVDGTGSRWDSSQLFVGDEGFGLLRIAHGGAVTNTYDGALGWVANATGTAIVDGAGSKWNAGYFTVGSAGAAALHITGGGAVTATTYASINSKSLLAIDVGNGSLFKVEDGTGTLANSGAIRILAGAGAAAATYTPIAAIVTGSGARQSVGGKWDTSTNQITVSAATNGSSGNDITGINLATTQRVLVSDSRGWAVGASFLASSNTIDFTATAISGSVLTDLQTLAAGESVRSGWAFSADNYVIGSTTPVYLSLKVGSGWSLDDLDLWHYTTADGWKTYSATDMTYDGTYVSFTATSFSGYAVTAVPEPSAIILVGMGMTSLLAHLWRRLR
jgi:T5SS/PEP-CTERM-associated repeat protein